jgi:hypothetical protein
MSKQAFYDTVERYKERNETFTEGLSKDRFDKQLKHNGITITVDNGKEFKNNPVADYCSRNNIFLKFINPGSPWEIRKKFIK